MKVNNISFQQGRKYSVSRSNWDKAKFDTTLLANIEEVQTNQYYLKAKKGNYQDTIQLALEFYTNNSLEKLQKLHNNTIIVPVMAEEKQGKNAIPLGMAHIIQKQMAGIELLATPLFQVKLLLVILLVWVELLQVLNHLLRLLVVLSLVVKF